MGSAGMSPTRKAAPAPGAGVKAGRGVLQDYAEAEPLLRANLAGWKAALVAADDPWFGLINDLIATARTQRIRAAIKSGDVTADQRAEMTTLADQLMPMLTLMGEQVAGAPVHQLALSALADLCRPDMLNKPAELARATKILEVAAEPRFDSQFRPR